jgi:hypothetical protein
VDVIFSSGGKCFIKGQLISSGYFYSPKTYLYSPVHSCLKFSAVLGQISANNSIFILPAGMLPIETSTELVRKEHFSFGISLS